MVFSIRHIFILFLFPFPVLTTPLACTWFSPEVAAEKDKERVHRERESPWVLDHTDRRSFSQNSLREVWQFACARACVYVSVPTCMCVFCMKQPMSMLIYVRVFVYVCARVSACGVFFAWNIYLELTGQLTFLFFFAVYQVFPRLISPGIFPAGILLTVSFRFITSFESNLFKLVIGLCVAK